MALVYSCCFWFSLRLGGLLISFFSIVKSNYDIYIKTVLCFYIMACVIYIYGAFKLVNILMFPYISLELLRLIGLSFFGITGLLVLKKNTMDIGLLIVISLVVGFTLLGMFYLWICAMNLPIVINEINANEQTVLLVFSLGLRLRKGT
ncbi:uncharacterized protein LOC123710623 [Pieris brassicae]|uniref:uncharacterized protein LOC123710623 n=1 Tax=Pieris brassicae TaxID=7116 RepID=UPI001E65F330|nr:uncharacterized protein LOC123710623 [Pieris brassicae]